MSLFQYREFERKGPSLLKISGINGKSRVLYHGAGFLSSATWPLMKEKHYNGLMKPKDIKLCTVCLIIIYEHRFLR